MSQRAANALTTLRPEDCAQPFDICLNHRQLSSTTAVTRDMSFDRNFCLPARSWISLISYIDDPSLRVSISTLFILQTTGAPSSRHCPSQDHRGDLCSVFQGWLGRRRCRYRCGGVCGRRSGVGRQSQAHVTISRAKEMPLACWFIRTMPMSLRSMSLSKVDSMVALSVLLSTTRKFFCESGPVVTCYPNVRYNFLPCRPRSLHQCQRGADRLLSPGSRSAEEARGPSK